MDNNICPICENNNKDILLSIDCGNIDRSSLYKIVTIASCKKCGHIFNLINERDMQGIMRYYQEEYSNNNINSPNKNGDIPGSVNESSIKRYKVLYKIISCFLKKDFRILDIGCATGGFLKYLKFNGYHNLYGVEFSSVYVDIAKETEGIIIKKGTAEDIQFEEKLDFLIADQVVEHLYDPNKIFIQAKKLLKNNGYLCISVPNAKAYTKNYFFDFYWFLMREHIHHFDYDHLVSIACKHGFSLECIKYNVTPMLSNEVTLPSLTIVLKTTNKHYKLRSSNVLRRNTIAYIKKSYQSFDHKIKSIEEIAISKVPLCIWGISREFLFLYNNTDLKNCNILYLIDDTPFKQTKTFNDMRVYPSSKLKSIPSEVNIFITAFAHKNILEEKLKFLNIRNKIISV